MTVPESVRAAGLPARDAYESIWASLIQDASDQGVLHGGSDLGVIRLALLGSMNATLQWFDPAGPRSLEDVAETIAACFAR